MTTTANNQTGTGRVDGWEDEPVLPCACQRQSTVLQPDGGSKWQVTCRHCGRRGPMSEPRWIAIKLWNNDRKGVTTDAWQPIETAPDDGEFLVYTPNERRKIQAAEWHSNFKVIGNHFAFDLTKPTHWMPLPEPPTTGGING